MTTQREKDTEEAYSRCNYESYLGQDMYVTGFADGAAYCRRNIVRFFQLAYKDRSWNDIRVLIMQLRDDE